MAYFKIGKYEVLYSDHRFTEINKPFYEGLSAHEIICLNILDFDGKPNNQALKLKELQIDKLNTDLKNLGDEKFIIKWVNFDFKGETAQSLAYEIISDYFNVKKNGSIIDIRDFNDKVVDESAGKSISFPAGESVMLEFSSYVDRNIFSRVFQTNRKIQFPLTISEVNRISGNLSSLKVETKNHTITMGDNIAILAV